MSATRAVEPDEKWASDCLAYNLQANLDQTTKLALCDLQGPISSLLPGNKLLMTPTPAMHVSLYALVYVHWDSPHKQAYWEEISERTLTRLQQLCSAMSPFSLQLDQLRVSSRAIIALSRQACEPIAQLRQQLSTLLSAADVPRPSHDIVHTTLARFAEPAGLDASAVLSIEQLAPAVRARVESISVIRELVYPSLAGEEVRRFSLGGACEPQG